MDEHEQGEKSYVPEARVLAIVLARSWIGFCRVTAHALAVGELQTIKRTVISIPDIIAQT